MHAIHEKKNETASKFFMFKITKKVDPVTYQSLRPIS